MMSGLETLWTYDSSTEDTTTDSSTEDTTTMV